MERIVSVTLQDKAPSRETITKIEELCQNHMPLKESEINSLLENLCWKVRKKIAEANESNIQDDSYAFKCDLAQSMIVYYFQKLGISANPVNTNEVLNGTCGHSFVLVTIQEKIYLVDPTYIQFFEKDKCDVERFTIINDTVCTSPDPGFFIELNQAEETVMPLLEKGYIEFKEEVAKAYGDSFFQTKTGVSPSQIKYNVATGTLYKKWFESYTSKLSKTEEELRKMGLLLEPFQPEDFTGKRLR